ncbi:histidine--tRNA ligase [Picrophilus oshimae]|uniref:Histidine--tRNA ligase n=1 Tax=Picrophilus torridus (strain ATCC 700027 / DSM 9790 / JCM 10055 / NBRC 100828 / KAW 2/3) TaxID=1122961 RepID=SYH_PICTO|nr:histidine--tRNA ligase [Picrophilus oshimae]Q6L1Q5.1 RecName: Full=Histidine--tRNA ligase; AltName: Full=Histidyl-tRNA synthetase; Short=HisRS [Picrophilus oshimae DSM 9789]AAT43097.1 histidyl-tRNA synthetase [Picrophilus oshimae DSM 9789]
MKIERLKGFRDHYPDDMEIRYDFIKKMMDTAISFGYKMIDFPSLESMDLYRLKSGTELVEQTFSFTDKGGREVTMIPEATPSTMRMLTSRKDIKMPARWFSIPKVWRYEEPQEGRYREHIQFNADMFGADSPEADAEIIGLAATILDNLGLSGQYEINVNDRYLMELILRDLGSNNPVDLFPVIDRFKKMDLTDFKKRLLKDLDDDASEKLISLLMNRIDINDVERLLNGYANDVMERVKRLKDTFALTSKYTKSKLNIDLSVVRGLSYYTGIVFEAFDISGELRAILGGGRYDNLSNLFINESIPAVGFAIGDAVIELLLKRNNLWNYKDKRKRYYVVNISSSPEAHIEILNKIRGSGNIAISEVNKRRMQTIIKYAESIKCDFLIIIGDRELSSKKMTIKNLRTQEQAEMNIDDFINNINS